MFLRSRFLSLAGVALTLTVLASAASADKGRPEVGSAGGPIASNQQPRVRFVNDGRCFRATSAGVRTRHAVLPGTAVASGTVFLPPGPTAASIRWAGLYWVILGNQPPVNAVTLNGNPVAPLALPVTASPCWSELFAYAYFADVTAFVVPGANLVSGLDDSGAFGSAPESEGASLVVVYESETSGACEIVVFDGNDLVNGCGQQVDLRLPVVCPPGVPGSLWFIGGDGQTAPTYPGFDDNQLWNGVALGDNDDFDASDVPGPGAAPDVAWDTDPRSIVVAPPNTASINTLCTSGGDCIDWVATVLEVGVRECAPVSTEPSNWGSVKQMYR